MCYANNSALPCLTVWVWIWACTCMGRAELTVENKSKQPSLLMTQYTSGSRGPFPFGCERKQQTCWTMALEDLIDGTHWANTFKGVVCQYFHKSGAIKRQEKIEAAEPLQSTFKGTQVIMHLFSQDEKHAVTSKLNLMCKICKSANLWSLLHNQSRKGYFLIKCVESD